MPKQFIPLFQGQSLFQQTVTRNLSVCDEVMVISNVQMKHLAEQQLQQQGGTGRYILEPMGRNTAPAIALGALLLQPEDIILVTTSDHIIRDQTAFESAVSQAIQFAQAGHIATFGIQPSHPETGFGYIEYEGNDVIQFKEKPDFETAQRYVDSGRFLWNSGMFCFRVDTLLNELETHASDVLVASRTAIQEVLMRNADEQIVEAKINPELMAAIPSISIDYAVMERSSKIKVIPCDIGWSDLGSFDALYEEFLESHADDAHNVQLHEDITLQPTERTSNTEMIESKRNLLVQSTRSVAMIGVEDLLVVDTPDALLIANRGDSQSVSKVAKALKAAQSPLMDTHTTTYRPWGAFQNLLDEPGYKVKRIVVSPGQKLSLQKHQYRAEHWTVVEGTAWVHNDGKEFELSVSEATFIPQGAVHRLENRTDEMVVLIEVQTGSYTGEDDIIRLEDIYGRA
jgi:mannose-1-phosphate guanylyltransferase